MRTKVFVEKPDLNFALKFCTQLEEVESFRVAAHYLDHQKPV